MSELRDVERVREHADTAYCVVYEGLKRPPTRGGLPRPCAIKVAKGEDDATLRLMEAEYTRLGILMQIDLGDEPALVPEPLGFEVLNGETTLVMEWVSGVSLEDQTGRGKPNPKPGLYVVQTLRRLLAMLEVAHAQNGLNAVLPDFKRDAIILAGGGVRVLDWNVVHAYDDGGAVRDFQAAIQFVIELALGSRLGSFAAAREALNRLTEGLEDALLRTLLTYAHRLADTPGGRRDLCIAYDKLRTLATAYEEALSQLHRAQLGIGDAGVLRAEIGAAHMDAVAQMRRGEPPELVITPQQHLVPTFSGRTPPARRGFEPTLDRLMERLVEAGLLNPDQIRAVHVTAGSVQREARVEAQQRPGPARAAMVDARAPRPAELGSPSGGDLEVYEQLRVFWPHQPERLAPHVSELQRLYERYPGYSDSMPLLRQMLKWASDNPPRSGSSPRGRR